MKKFIKTVENFKCENCGFKVKGNGYTNHCPKCLYSKHVDVNPGDRENECQGLMKPINLEIEKGKHVITFQCTKCGAVKRNHANEQDSVDALVKLSETIAKKVMF